MISNEEAIEVIRAQMANDWAEACDKAVDALERLIPSPLLNPLVIRGVQVGGACKRCNVSVQYGNKYCSNCGQAVRWNKDE